MQLTSATSQAALYQNEVCDLALCKLSYAFILCSFVPKNFILFFLSLVWNISFILQCEALMRRLTVSDECRSASEQEMDKQREKVNQLRETLQTTSRYVSYFCIHFLKYTSHKYHMCLLYSLHLVNETLVKHTYV